MPQEAIEAGDLGSVYLEDESYIGIRPGIPTITENGYFTDGVEIIVLSVNHEYVDLGLPSGTLWATCNVGAETPGGRGDYFSWGEIEPKSSYYWSTYQYCHGSYSTLTKYCNNLDYGYNGFTDNLTNLLPEDDAATANWGVGWRMPTSEEWQELYQNTTQTLTYQYGTYGQLFTATNGNTLFLPAAGYRFGNDLENAGNCGHYWLNAININTPYFAYNFNFGSGANTYSDARCYGRPVRPVRSTGQN